MKASLRVTLVRYFLGLSVLFPAKSYGLSQNEFRARLGALKQSQKLTDQRLKNLGVASPVFSAPEGEEQDPSKKKPLFTLHESASRLRAEAGRRVFGTIHNRLVVGGENVFATIQIDSNQGLFAGLRILGKARQSGTEGRVAIECDRLITRSGKPIPIKGYIEDEAGASGLEAQIFSSKAIAIAGALGASFISGLASSQQTQTPTAFGFNQVEPTGRNAVLQGVAKTAADQSKRFIEDSTKEKHVLIVEGETPVVVYLDEEVRF